MITQQLKPTRSSSRRQRLGIALVALLLVAIGIVGGSFLRAPNIGGTAIGASAASKGRIPPDAVDSQGRVIVDRVPDYIGIWSRDGLSIAGYVSKTALFGPDGFASRPTPVYGDDLKEIVGEMVPGIGFVPNGSDPADFPKVEANTGE